MYTFRDLDFNNTRVQEMPLSLGKLEKLVNKYNFAVASLYVLEKQCRFVKLVSLSSGTPVLVHVDSTYDFYVEDCDKHMVRITPVEFSFGDTVLEKYTRKPDPAVLEQKYPKITTSFEIPEEGVERIFESRYKARTHLKDLARAEMCILKECFRQLRRLALCVQGLRYRACVSTHAYMCVSNLGESITGYALADNDSVKKEFFPVCDLEFFYEKADFILSDAETIIASLYSTFAKNQKTTFDTTTAMLQNIPKSLSAIPALDAKKATLSASVAKNSNTLQAMHDAETKMLADFEKAHEEKNVLVKGDLEQRIRSAQHERRKLLRETIKLKEQLAHLNLVSDSFVFDLGILVHAAMQNAAELATLARS